MRWVVPTLLLPLIWVGGCSEPRPTGFVLDREGVLTAAQHARLDSLYDAHEQRTGNEIAMVVHQTFNGRSARDFAVAYGDSLGVGKKERHNGVVIAFSPGRREVFIATGRGTQNVMPDSVCQRIVDEEMIPRFKEERYFEGLWNGSLAIVEFLDRPGHRID